MQTTIGLRDLLEGVIDEYARMGAPETDISQARQALEALLGSMDRLVDWREQNGLTSPGVKGIEIS